MRLNDILKDIDVLEIKGNRTCDIINFHFDSRLISENDMFIAINGVTQDGNKYINSAIEKGASVIVCDKIPQLINDKVTYVLSKNTRKALSKISCNFYGNPSKKIKLIGVTGTNGKTSVVNLLHQLFSNLGEKSGLISTVGNLVGDKKIKSTHTTPDSKQLNSLINKMVEEKCSYCFMEVSSHAIDQERISDLNFDIAVFTNITHDHLDYHKNFENYLNAKKLFFDNLDSTSIALVNKDDKRNDPRFFGNSATISGEKTIVEKGVYTSCEMREDKKCPWSIRAEKIEHDNPKKTIYYQNAVMKNEISKRDDHEIIIASDSVIAEYKKILAPIESDWLDEMKGKGLDGDAVLKRARQIITAVEG